MNRFVVAFASVAVAGGLAAAGFVAGARYSSSHHVALLLYERGAYEAGESARFLAAVRAGKAQPTTQFFENRIDTAFVNLTYAPSLELSPGARAELKLAADYRKEFPSTKKNTDWDARLEQGILRVR